MTNRFRVISERHGLIWTGDDPKQAEYQALVAAVHTGRTVDLLDGSDRPTSWTAATGTEPSVSIQERR